MIDLKGEGEGEGEGKERPRDNFLVCNRWA